MLDKNTPPLTLKYSSSDKLDQIGSFVRRALDKKDCYLRFTIKNERKHMPKEEKWVDPKEYKIDESQEVKDEQADEVHLDESVRDDKDLQIGDILKLMLADYGNLDGKGDKKLHYQATLINVELVPKRTMRVEVFMKDVDQAFKDKLKAFLEKIKSYRVPTYDIRYHDAFEPIPERKSIAEYIVVVTDDNFSADVIKEEDKVDKIFFKSKSDDLKNLRKTHNKFKVIDPVPEKLFAARHWDFQFDAFPPKI